jgi:hypothetical protein
MLETQTCVDRQRAGDAPVILREQAEITVPRGGEDIPVDRAGGRQT